MGLTKPRAYQIFDIDYKQAVRVITLTNITLSGGAPSTVDGVSLSVGSRILVAGQSTGSQNGLYQVSVVGTGSNGTWIRSVDTNESGELNAGTIVMVTEGTTYKDTQWKLTTNDPIVIGTTALVFEQNSAFAFGNIYANSTAVLADIVGDTVTFTPANNMVILANATSDTITFEVSQSPNFTGAVSVTGNITGGNLNTAGTANINTLAVTGLTTLGGNTTVSGHLLPSANIAYDIGSPTQRWRSLYVGANTIDIGGATISANLVTGSLILTGPDGAEFILSGTSITNSLGTFGFVEIGSNTNATSTTSGALKVLGGVGITGNVYAGGQATITGNVTAGALFTTGNITGNYFLGNVACAAGIFTTKIFSGNTEINIPSANGNANITIGGVSNVAVFSTSGATVTGTLGVSGNITGGNVAGTLLTGTLTTAAQPNVTSVGTLTGLSISGNLAVAGNVAITGNVNYANVTDLVVGDPLVFLGANNTSNVVDLGFIVTYDDGLDQHGGWVRDASDGTWKLFGNVVPEPTTTVNFSNAIYQPMLSGSITSTGIVSAVGNLIGANIISNALLSGATLSVSGNANVGNISGTSAVFTNITGTLATAAQPNVTSVGTLTSLSVSGNANVGNLGTVGLVVASGNVTGGNINSAGTGVFQGNVRFGGEANTQNSGFIGWSSVDQFGFVSEFLNAVLIRNEQTTNEQTIYLGDTSPGNPNTLFGIASGAGNGTAVLTLTGTGNLTVANVTPTGVVNAIGNVTGSNLNTAGNANITGNVSAGNILLSGNIFDSGTSLQINTTTAANISLAPNQTIVLTATTTGANITGTLNATGNANVGNLGTAGLIVATGNVTGGNVVTAGQVTATGNVNGNFITGNGSALTGINAFGTIVVAGSDNVVADSTADTLTLVAGDGVVITTSAGTDTITISTSGSSESIFITGGDMGTVDELVTQEQDLGPITEVVDTEIDMGQIVTAGVFYPDQIVFPSYTVAQLASLSAVPAGQMVYCSNESGGAVPAFSDGTNWRRVTDRAIVT